MLPPLPPHTLGLIPFSSRLFHVDKTGTTYAIKRIFFHVIEPPPYFVFVYCLPPYMG
jgi:hypothetical protein